MPTGSENASDGPSSHRVGLALAMIAALLGFAVADAWQPPPKQLLASAAVEAIDVYRATVSVALARTGLVRCRFQPTCSAYAREAFTRYGMPKGLLLATGRLLRCHPFAKGGVDPVP
jgi:putative membrane protein insertion efficiency factor